MVLQKPASISFVLYGVLCLVAFTVTDNSAQTTAPIIHPILRLEKPRYLLGESVRFWVGVEKDGFGPIPAPLKRPCSLTITKPDGSSAIQSVGWPIDGDPDLGWTGGWGVQPKEAGAYLLQLEYNGQRTERVPLIVEADDVLHDIFAAFEFEKSGSIDAGVSVAVVLRVTNNSRFPIRFPQRGAMMEGISIWVKRESPAYYAAFFYPWEKLTQSTVAPDTFTWDFAEKIPSITLDPGQSFRQRLSLEDAYQFDQPGTYTVTFSTVLSVLVGDRHGPYADFCPIRVVAEKSQTFIVSGRTDPVTAH